VPQRERFRRIFNGLGGPLRSKRTGAAMALLARPPAEYGYPGWDITRCTILRYPDIDRV
jgi:hypothetical protein